MNPKKTLFFIGLGFLGNACGGAGEAHTVELYVEAVVSDASLTAEATEELLPAHTPNCGTAGYPTISDFRFDDGKTARVTLTWSDRDNSDHDSYDIRVYFKRREGGTITGTQYSADAIGISKYARAAVLVIGGINTFGQLGKMGDSTKSLWQVDVLGRVRERCTNGLSTYKFSGYRPIAFLTRPYPDANLGVRLYPPKAGLLTLGSLDQTRMYDLNAAVEAADCDRLLLSVSGTTGEAKAGPNGVHGFMRGMSFDCVVNVAYHDKDGGSGGRTDDDTRYYCGSTDIGYNSLHYAWLYSVRFTGVGDNFDMYGHSKGAAITIRRHQSWPWVYSSYPNGRYYAVGVPWKRGSEYLSNYSRGYTKRYGPIVAMTFNNDPVHDIDKCGDLWDAVQIDNRHNYNGFTADHSAHGCTHRDDLPDFQSSTYDWVGSCYTSGDGGC